VQADNIRSTDRIPTQRVDWWNYDGIVRDVSLEISSRAFISRQQIVAIPHLVAVDSADRATITTTVTIQNASTEPFEGTITGDVLDEATGASVLASLPTLQLVCQRAKPLTLN
jgi:beta-galactosidase/beta-glucuronidase